MNFKLGASENNLQIETDLKREELYYNYFLKKIQKNIFQYQIKNLFLFENFTKNKIKFNITKKIINSLPIFGFLFILGSLLFFNSQSKVNESQNINKQILFEIGFSLLKKIFNFFFYIFIF